MLVFFVGIRAELYLLISYQLSRLLSSSTLLFQSKLSTQLHFKYFQLIQSTLEMKSQRSPFNHYHFSFLPSPPHRKNANPMLTTCYMYIMCKFRVGSALSQVCSVHWMERKKRILYECSAKKGSVLLPPIVSTNNHVFCNQMMRRQSMANTIYIRRQCWQIWKTATTPCRIDRPSHSNTSGQIKIAPSFSNNKSKIYRKYGGMYGL